LTPLRRGEPAACAADEFQRYGKGQGHPAQLNMGDCAVYALAKTLNEPLLFVGNDFTDTDVEPC
jgi:ribonuclease VapC